MYSVKDKRLLLLTSEKIVDCKYMKFLLLLLLIVACLGDIQVLINQKGGYTININGQCWLQSSQTAVYTDNKWYSSTDNSLLLTNITYAEGIDANLGHWNETQLKNTELEL